jgi:phytoene dehydrogenase-like protein
MSLYDAVIVGSGPNGLAAAITLASEGLKVVVLEASGQIGGGVRSSEMTLPGFIHDICSAVYPMAVGSPFFRRLPLADYGLEWIDSPVPLAHPLDDGSAVLLERSVESTASGLEEDAEAYRRLFAPLVANWEGLAREILAPIHFPQRPLLLARFGLVGLRSARSLAEARFRSSRSRALFAGLAGHSFLSLESPGSAAFALVLGLFGHAQGWPIVRGGSQRLSDSLLAHFQRLGGEVRTEFTVRSIADLPNARAVLFDLSPRQFNAIVGERRNPRRRRFGAYRPGPGVFKVDWALSGPIPWSAAACARAATVHLGGDFDEIARSEDAVSRGAVGDRPFVLLAQPTLFDRSRAPVGGDIAWGYCHVPNGFNGDRLAAIESQIERFAPGFRERVLARRTFTPTQLETHNANYLGGDISGGANDLGQLFTRPILQWGSYDTGLDGFYLCSASTPPGGGVHGMCGYHAARAALWQTFGRRLEPLE